MQFYDDKESLYIIVDGLYCFCFNFMAVYALVYFASMTFYSRNIMLIYSIINPWYGSFMQKLSMKSYIHYGGWCQQLTYDWFIFGS